MKKLFSLLLVLTILFTVSCSPEKKEAEAHIQYTIFTGSGSRDISDTAKQTDVRGNTVSFASSSTLDVRFTDIREKVENNSQASEITLTLGKQTYTLPYKYTYKTGLSSCKNSDLSKHNLTVSYESKDRPFTIAEYRVSTGELIFFTILAQDATGGDFTTEQAKKSAANLIDSLYGKEVAARYTFDRVSEPSENESGYGYIYVTYRRYVCGYPTDDYIQIKFNKDGTVNAINALKIGLFEPILDTITPKKVQNAYDTLRQTVSDHWRFSDENIQLVIAADGKCYVRVYAISDSYSDKFYINVT